MKSNSYWNYISSKKRPTAISIFCLALINFYSCKKEWFDKKPNQSITVPASLKDFQLMMDNPILNIESPGLGETGTDNFYSTDAAFNDPSTEDVGRNTYTWSHTKPTQNVKDWNKTYQKVLYYNTVLEGLDKVKIFSSDEQKQRNQIKGDALFRRSLAFYELAQEFAPPFNSATQTSDLSIPLKLESDINIPSVRSTTKATYDQIINDLSVAKDLLPSIPLYKTRGSKAAVFALLARIYLIIGDYQKAKQNSDSCLGITNSLMDYKNVSASPSYPFQKLNVEVIYYEVLTGDWMTIVLGYVDTTLYNSYDTSDLRKTLFFKVSGNTVTFRGSYNQNIAFFGGITTDEQYLIRAECNARLGNPSTALNDLNTLMFTRWKNNGTWTSFTANNADEALSKILIERRKELIARNLRWSDLRRLNKENRFKVTIVHKISGNTYTLEPNSYKYTLPIPDDIIGFSGMQQNAGWQ